jgi:hypothetical protein
MHSGYLLWPHFSLPDRAENLSICMLCYVVDYDELVLRGTSTHNDWHWNPATAFP